MCIRDRAARCIAGVFDSQDMVGRIGGDEFLVFSKQLSGREEIMKQMCIRDRYTPVIGSGVIQEAGWYREFTVSSLQ